MTSHARQTLDVLKELTAMFPWQDPIRTATAFTDVSKHRAALQTINVDARIVPDRDARPDGKESAADRLPKTNFNTPTQLQPFCCRVWFRLE